MSGAFLREALDLARQGKGQTSPNPAVGAVLERDGRPVKVALTLRDLL